MTASRALSHPLIVATIAGVMAWLTRASFDVAGTTEAPVRVAMLPSLAELMGLVVLALLTVTGIAWALRSRQKPDAPFWNAARDAVLPLLALALLILPYLPWLADWVPAVQLLAGPGRFILWVVVTGQLIWMVLPKVSPSTSGLVFACVAVFLSAPFVMGLPAFPGLLAELFSTIRQLPTAQWSTVQAGSIGAFFDQEFGIFAYAPVLLLAFIGLAGMAGDPARRRLAIPLALAILLLILIPGTSDPWWKKSALFGRELLLLPLLVPPLAWLYARLPDNSLLRAGARLLLLVSLAVTAVMVLLGDRVPARQEADGASTLLYWLSPTWQLWSEAPTYVTSDAGSGTLRVLVWLAVFGIVVWAFSRWKVSTAGSAALVTTTAAPLVFVAVVSATSIVVSDPSQRFDVERRVMFPMLETFDPIARPIAVRYSPLSMVSPDDLPPMFTLSAVPGERTDPQPIRIVMNARFRLPAGDYVLDLTGSESAGTVPNASIALQIGREGRPLVGWPLTLRPGEHAQQRFQLPVDTEFVGFRAGRPVEPAIAELRVTPLRVVDVRRRFRTARVLSAASFRPATIFFHDSNAYAERDGFWVKGRATASFTVKKTNDTEPGVPLGIHSGPRPNVVTVSTPTWSQKLELVPGVTQRVVVPTADRVVFVPVTISAAEGFVPAEVEGSTDERLLGAWVAFITDDASRTAAAR
jgi:hypothetical protein